MHKDYTGCMCVVGSMTAALRAERMLVSMAIPVRIVKTDTGTGGHGCAYALSFSCTQQRNVQSILEKNGIRVKKFLGGME